jgi:hypothetical protein
MRRENSKEEFPEFGAALRVMGTGLDLAGISSSLGINPTHVHRQGEPGPLKQPFPLDMWSLESPLDPAEPLEAHLKWLQTALSPNYQFLSSLQKLAKLDIYCNAMYFSDQNSLELSPKVLRLFTELDISLGVSIILLPEEDPILREG